MCAIMEEYVDEVIYEKIKDALQDDLDAELIVKVLKVPMEKVLKIKEEMQS